MMEQGRLIATIVYLASIAATLFVAFQVGAAGGAAAPPLLRRRSSWL